jgi:hypothetical protein
MIEMPARGQDLHLLNLVKCPQSTVCRKLYLSRGERYTGVRVPLSERTSPAPSPCSPRRPRRRGKFHPSELIIYFTSNLRPFQRLSDNTFTFACLVNVLNLGGSGLKYCLFVHDGGRRNLFFFFLM